MTITRKHTGHRCGECHGRAKYPDATVRRALELRERGFSYGRIAQQVGAPKRTVADWCRRDTRWSA